MPKGKLTKDGEVIAAYGAAMSRRSRCSSTALKRVTRYCRASFPRPSASTWSGEEQAGQRERPDACRAP